MYTQKKKIITEEKAGPGGKKGTHTHLQCWDFNFTAGNPKRDPALKHPAAKMERRTPI